MKRYLLDTALEQSLEMVTTDGDYTRVPGLTARLVTRAQLR